MKVDQFRELLGIKTLEIRDGYVKMSLKVTKEHTNIAGFTHGGVLFSLADCAFAEAVNFGEKKAGQTLQNRDKPENHELISPNKPI